VVDFNARYYYQYDESQLSACTLPIHGLLHVALDIRYCGPCWTTWTFYMERFCGIMQSALQSRTKPWSNLSKRNLHFAYVAQLSTRYDLDEELGTISSQGLKRGEKLYEDCTCQFLTVKHCWIVKQTDPDQIMRAPYRAKYALDQPLRIKIATYLGILICRR
jgi:hypothetical protein